jgi:hypothetical protein
MPNVAQFAESKLQTNTLLIIRKHHGRKICDAFLVVIGKTFKFASKKKFSNPLLYEKVHIICSRLVVMRLDACTEYEDGSRC